MQIMLNTNIKVYQWLLILFLLVAMGFGYTLSKMNRLEKQLDLAVKQNTELQATLSSLGE